jgi:hypothetical protein
LFRSSSSTDKILPKLLSRTLWLGFEPRLPHLCVCEFIIMVLSFRQYTKKKLSLFFPSPIYSSNPYSYQNGLLFFGPIGLVFYHGLSFKKKDSPSFRHTFIFYEKIYFYSCEKSSECIFRTFSDLNIIFNNRKSSKNKFWTFS